MSIDGINNANSGGPGNASMDGPRKPSGEASGKFSLDKTDDPRTDAETAAAKKKKDMDDYMEKDKMRLANEIIKQSEKANQRLKKIQREGGG